MLTAQHPTPNTQRPTPNAQRPTPNTQHLTPNASPVAVLGAGSWGTALALLLAENGQRVRLWARDATLAATLAADRENRRYLPGFALPALISLTADLRGAVQEAEVILFAVPSEAVRQVASLAVAEMTPEALLLSASKGMEEGTGLRMSEVLAATLPQAASRTVVLSGPNLAVEIARGLPSASVAASQNPEAAQQVQHLFSHQAEPTFRVYTSSDVVGVELGGAVKNVIAIAAGIADGLGLGDNSKAALMTRGLAETIRLGVAQGAKAETFLGLSGVGDLIATAGSRLSRNYRVGYGLGQGKSLEAILAELGQVAEGVPTTRVLYEFAARFGVEMPLCSALYTVLFEDRPASATLHDLMRRPLKAESLPS